MEAVSFPDLFEISIHVSCSAKIICTQGGGRVCGGFLFAWFWLLLMEKGISVVLMQMFFFKLITLLG